MLAPIERELALEMNISRNRNNWNIPKVIREDKIVVLRNLKAQVTVGERLGCKTTFVVTDSTIVCGKDLLRKMELYFTLVNAVWRRNGLRS